MGLTLTHFLVLGALLFCIGLYGAIAKHNAIAVLMGLSLWLRLRLRLPWRWLFPSIANATQWM